MTGTLRLVLTRAVATLALLGGPGTARAADDAAGATVAIENFTFQPQHLIVPAGTVVTWINEDDIPHLVVGDGDPDLASAVLDTEDRFSFTFDRPGSYAYFCELHPHMQGVVEVTPRPG